MSKKARLSRARKKAREISRWYHSFDRREAVTREDLMHRFGLTRTEADDVYEYLVSQEFGAQKDRFGERYVPVIEDGVFEALLADTVLLKRKLLR